MSIRIKISENPLRYGKSNFKASVENKKDCFEGSIEKRYISEEKQKEVKEHGYAFVNQPKERIV